MSLQNGRYPETARVISKSDIKDLYEHLGAELPGDIDNIPEKNLIVFSAGAEGMIFGMICAAVPEGADFCRIMTILLPADYRTVDNIAFLIGCICRAAGSTGKIKKTVWRYVTSKSDDLDPYLKVCSRVTGTKAEVKTIDRIFLMDLHTMIEVQPKILRRNESFMGSRGFRIVRCIDLSEKHKKEAEILVKNGDDEIKLLSPFDGMERDEENSFFVLGKEDDNVYGWMICRKKYEGCVELARFYVLSDRRKSMTGLDFGGYVLRRLERVYDRAWLKVLPENGQLLRFMRGFFGQCIKESAEKLITMTGQAFEP